MRWFVCFLLALLFIGGSVKSSTIELQEQEQRPSRAIRDSQEIVEKEMPDFSTFPSSQLTPVQKVECCFCLYLPCTCALACCSELTSCLNTATCGLFFQCFPCLSCQRRS